MTAVGSAITTVVLALLDILEAIFGFSFGIKEHGPEWISGIISALIVIVQAVGWFRPST